MSQRCDSLDTKAYYEAEENLGKRNLEEARDPRKFRPCLKMLPRRFHSLVDAGCGEGFWLEYVLAHHPQIQCVGYELADNRVKNALARLPGLDIRQGDMIRLPAADKSFDVGTAMDVLEHLPDWGPAVEELVRVSRKAVLLAVPYRQVLGWQVCIHCHRQTPSNGHLHSFTESSFARWAERHRMQFGYIHHLGAGPLKRLYHKAVRSYMSMIVRIDLA